jgi:hypothetical protein
MGCWDGAYATIVGKSKGFIQTGWFLAHKQFLAKFTMAHSTLANRAIQRIQSLYELNNMLETEVLRKVGWLLEKDRFTCPCAGHDACCP